MSQKVESQFSACTYSLVALWFFFFFFSFFRDFMMSLLVGSSRFGFYDL